ncbi:MAG: DUF3196 domain-containing protein [Lactimicrobium sp.]|jgi:hypothetical protein|uniref:DUF3196 domain-containing protein n=1 Tax=Lactimicrobium sp. TaxID=2563780 RepID=UPI002F3601F4
MENYYDEIIAEIQKAIDDKKYEEAEYLLQRELKMPYIPEDAEKKLHALAKDLAYAMSDAKPVSEESADTLIQQLLSDKPALALSAASALCSRSLREYLREIQSYLAGNPLPEAAALLMEGMAEQGINEEFTLNKDGCEYDFWSGDIIPIAKQPAFKKADALLKGWFAKNPAYYNMARTLLIHELYIFLPLMYEEDEAYDVAHLCAKQVSEMMDGGSTIAAIDAKRRRLS